MRDNFYTPFRVVNKDFGRPYVLLTDNMFVTSNYILSPSIGLADKLIVPVTKGEFIAGLFDFYVDNDILSDELVKLITDDYVSVSKCLIEDSSVDFFDNMRDFIRKFALEGFIDPTKMYRLYLDAELLIRVGVCNTFSDIMSKELIEPYRDTVSYLANYLEFHLKNDNECSENRHSKEEYEDAYNTFIKIREIIGEENKQDYVIVSLDRYINTYESLNENKE